MAAAMEAARQAGARGSGREGVCAAWGSDRWVINTVSNEQQVHGRARHGKIRAMIK
jgi:hypothetical protein